MNPRSLIWIGAIVGSTVGGYIPVFWDASLLSMTSIILSTIGGLAGIYVGFKMSQMM